MLKSWLLINVFDSFFPTRHSFWIRIVGIKMRWEISSILNVDILFICFDSSSSSDVYLVQFWGWTSLQSFQEYIVNTVKDKLFVLSLSESISCHFKCINLRWLYAHTVCQSYLKIQLNYYIRCGSIEASGWNNTVVSVSPDFLMKDRISGWPVKWPTVAGIRV